MKKCLLISVPLFFSLAGKAQEDSTSLAADSVNIDTVALITSIAPDDKVYKLKPKVDIPLTAIGTAWSLYAFTVIYSKDTSTTAKILSLKPEDVNSFDRPGTSVYYEKAKNLSDYFFYGSMPLPVILLADKAIRKDAAKIGLLYLEAMAVTGLLYTGATYLTDRYRPLAYNPEVPMETRKRGGAKNSFFAGHAALVGTSVFFTAKVYNDYHPKSKLKWVLYGAAAATTITEGYLRHRGGQHFFSDILLGMAVGTSSGLLIPQLHKVKLFRDNRLTILPVGLDGKGITARYILK